MPPEHACTPGRPMSGTVVRRIVLTTVGWLLFAAVAAATFGSVSDRALRVTAFVLVLAAGLAVVAAVLVAAFAEHPRAPVPSRAAAHRDDRLGRTLRRPAGLEAAQRVRVVVDDARRVKSFEPQPGHHAAAEVAHGGG
jgi:membrane protein implicated in regulation of membrane protease activity